MNAIRIDGRNLDFRNVVGFNKPQSEGFIFTSAAEARHNFRRRGVRLLAAAAAGLDPRPADAVRY